MMARLLRRILVTEVVFWWLLVHFWLVKGEGPGAEAAETVRAEILASLECLR